jgi:hypothetical protein
MKARDKELLEIGLYESEVFTMNAGLKEMGLDIGPSGRRPIMLDLMDIRSAYQSWHDDEDLEGVIIHTFSGDDWSLVDSYARFRSVYIAWKTMLHKPAK